MPACPDRQSPENHATNTIETRSQSEVVIPGAHCMAQKGDGDSLRAQSRRARRLADGLTQAADRQRLLDHAQELERKAAAMEQKVQLPKSEKKES